MSAIVDSENLLSIIYKCLVCLGAYNYYWSWKVK